MIQRYSYPAMRKIWEPDNKFRKWLRIEIVLCQLWASHGIIPEKSARNILEKASFNVKEIEKLEETTGHDLVAFLQSVGKNLGKDAKYLHYGVTSYDIEDTALSLLLKDSCRLIIQDIEELAAVIKAEALKYRYTLTAGRTHGMHAEPTTFGLKLLIWVSELERHLTRMISVREEISAGKVSGAVGTYATVPPSIEDELCIKLDLKPEKISSQIIQRDRHAGYLSELAILAGTVEKIALEIRHLQRTEVMEVEEGFKKGQKGSSAMPHKRNPIISERLCGLARVVRANALAGMENIALWHERDISHSSVERIILPDSSILIDYMLRKLTELIQNWVVYPERMKKNLGITGGLIFSQRLLLSLIDKGMTREKAYDTVQKHATEAWQKKKDFKKLISSDKEITSCLSRKELEKIFDYKYYLRFV
ncbi:MAG: adenylosuccinate lyase, partial [Firmicutes bacterium]|nr:adenylosuccinate lyase [Bacillota bacterium]